MEILYYSEEDVTNEKYNIIKGSHKSSSRRCYIFKQTLLYIQVDIVI